MWSLSSSWMAHMCLCQRLCLILTQKVIPPTRMRPRCFSLFRASSSDLNQKWNNLTLSHTNQLWTITSAKFICAGSTVSFWVWAIVSHSCRQCLCSPLFVWVQTVVGLEIQVKRNKTLSSCVWLKLSNLSLKWLFSLLNQSNSKWEKCVLKLMFAVRFCAVNSFIYGVKDDNSHISNMSV